MPTLVYQYPRCSTCKQALSWLRDHDVAFDAKDITLAPPSAKELARLWKLSGAPLSAFFNTSGESYRAGNFKERRESMSDAEQLAALAADGKLLKRPLVVVPATGKTEERVLVGFRVATYEAAFPARKR